MNDTNTSNTPLSFAHKLSLLRKEMTQKGTDIHIMVNSDPHQSEYLPEYWQSIRWLTGFSGEVATLVITREEAALWTDSRFFISGAQQLEGTDIQLMKMRMKGTPSIKEWIDLQIAKTTTDGKPNASCTISGDRRVTFGDTADLITLDCDLIDAIWTNRPSLPEAKIEIYPEKYAGESTRHRLQRIGEALRRQNADAVWLSALDDVAWALNLRGNDIHCTPVFLCYALIGIDRSILFARQCQLTAEVIDAMKEVNVEIRPYEEALPFINNLDGIRLAPVNPVPLMKGIKNDTEIEGYRKAMLRDGIALTQFYHWLDDELKAGHNVSELNCAKRLQYFRNMQPLYKDESFDAIVAWQEHGALPHYFPSEETDTTIKGDGLLLIDTGGHYLDGTTDITRTIGIGKVTDEMKRDYTLVLKGHIRLATAAFPQGTRGDQLDALARLDLWRDAKTYRHGTSHGVGHYLCVHEGPESIRMEHNPQVLLDGMLLSNEPAIYIGGKYGIRHENCILVRPFAVPEEASSCNQDEQGEFLCFETLTLCHIDTSCIDKSLMNREETEWLNHYNRWVFDTLSPHLSESDRTWLKMHTEPIT